MSITGRLSTPSAAIMRTISVFATAVLCALLGSCALLTEPGSGKGELQTEARPPHLILNNTGNAPVYYTILEQSLAARVLWGPCDRPLDCPRVAPGGRLSIRYDSIAGYDEVREPVALVYWWHLVRRGNAWEPDSIRVIPVPLQEGS
jgi:hypothetical protein